MKQTPAHEHHNPDLLRFIPAESKALIEVGCSSGALARAFKQQSPGCHYRGVEIDASYAELARRFCDECLTLDIELASPAFWEEQSSRDCWIFGDTLEHLKDPWTLLRNVRECIPNSGVVVACIPNLQHWSIQANLSGGNFRYQESGLLDRTHLRWFTRQTIIEMFDSAGFRIDDGLPRVFDEPGREVFLPIIEQMAKAVGADPTVAVSEALAMQYVIRASPI